MLFNFLNPPRAVHTLAVEAIFKALQRADGLLNSLIHGLEGEMAERRILEPLEAASVLEEFTQIQLPTYMLNVNNVTDDKYRENLISQILKSEIRPDLWRYVLGNKIPELGNVALEVSSAIDSENRFATIMRGPQLDRLVKFILDLPRLLGIEHNGPFYLLEMTVPSCHVIAAGPDESGNIIATIIPPYPTWIDVREPLQLGDLLEVIATGAAEVATTIEDFQLEQEFAPALGIPDVPFMNINPEQASGDSDVELPNSPNRRGRRRRGGGSSEQGGMLA